MSARTETRVLSLARRGTRVAHIARRTRLSQDVVVMLIATKGTPATGVPIRQEMPLAAASASLMRMIRRAFCSMTGKQLSY